MEEKSFKNIVYIDEKVITPQDKVQSAPMACNGNSLPQRGKDDSKSIIGRPKIYDLKGNLLASEENLVVLTGREYIAQTLAGVSGDNPTNYTQYRITHFAVGDGGSSGACPPTTTGPFDDDVELGNSVKINLPTSTYPSKYIAEGHLKQIESDGEISVISEEHTINVPTGGQKVVDAYTAIRYRMYLQPNEPIDKPFQFNEAGLYAVKYALDNNTGTWIPATDANGDHIYSLFARFTTLDKWLDAGDGIMIEWYILV